MKRGDSDCEESETNELEQSRPKGWPLVVEWSGRATLSSESCLSVSIRRKGFCLRKVKLDGLKEKIFFKELINTAVSFSFEICQRTLCFVKERREKKNVEAKLASWIGWEARREEEDR